MNSDSPIFRVSGLVRSAKFSRKNVVSTVGVFDEFHRGQRWLINRMVAHAKSIGAISVLLLIRPRPAEVLGLNNRGYVTSVMEAIREAKLLGIDYVGILVFNKHLAIQEPEQFFSWLKYRINVQEIWLGSGTTLGRGPNGNPTNLPNVAAKFGIKIQFVWSDQDSIAGNTTAFLEKGMIEASKFFRGGALGVIAGISHLHEGSLIVVFANRQILPPTGWYEVMVSSFKNTFDSKFGYIELVCQLENSEIIGKLVLDDASLEFLTNTNLGAVRLEFLKNAGISLIEALKLTLEPQTQAQPL